MGNKLFRSDERISAVYNRIGTIGFHALSVLVWLNFVYRIVVLNQRRGELLDIIIVLAFIGIFYIILISYFIREAVMSTSKEKPGGLSVAALVTGILPYIFTPVIPFILDPASPYSNPFIDFATPIMFFYIGIAFSLTTAAIVCGSIDLIRINTGSNSIKGRGLDIAGIVLGSIGVSYIILVLILVLIYG